MLVDPASSVKLTSTAPAPYSSAQTDTELVAAVTGRKIVVERFEISTDTAGTAFLESGGSTRLSPTFYLSANGGAVMDSPLYETAAGEALTLTTAISGNHSVRVQYYIKE